MSLPTLASTLVIAMDNSSSTMEARQAIANQCAAEFSQAVQDPKIDQVKFITVGSAKNPSVGDSKRIGPRDYAEYMTRDSATQHFKSAILAFPKRLENGKMRLDNSSAIYSGVFYDAPPLFRLKSGAPPEEGTLILRSDGIENEIVSDVTKASMPAPPSGVLRNIRVLGIGFGLGLDAEQQISMRKNWEAAMRQAGADFVAMKVR